MTDIAYDVETTGLRLYNGHEMFAWSTCKPSGESQVYRFDDQAVIYKTDLSKLDMTVDLWEAGLLTPVMHNAPFDLTATEQILSRKFAEQIQYHCTYLQACIVRNNHISQKLKDLAFLYADIPTDDEQEVLQYIRKNDTDYSSVPEDVMGRYQHLDALRAMLLHLFFYPRIQANPRWLEIYESEKRTQVVTMRMEERGVMIRRSACEQLIEELDCQVDQTLEEAADLVGKPVNLAGNELIWLLFQHFKVPVLRRTTTGVPCTDKFVMAELKEEHGDAFPIIDLVLKYRSYTHGASILHSYLNYADEDGLIHPSINSCAAVTARQSCSEPNLHNVEKSTGLQKPFPVPARRVFCPAPGYINIHIDFSGIELRILIHYAAVYFGKDKLLWDQIDKDEDLHYPACKIFYPEYDIMPLELQKPTRDAVKNVNFAGSYGASDIKMCKTATLPLEIGLPRVQIWRRAFPALSGLARTVQSQAYRSGYVETVFGRRLYLRKSHAAVNTLVQGTAAEVMKRAENNVEDYLNDATGGEVQMILTIHDELILKYPRTRLRDLFTVMRGVAEAMTRFNQFELPLKVDARVATYNWENTKPLVGWEV